MDDNNERAIGTYLGTDHKAYETVINGDLYIGEAEILGDNYYTAYKPIKDKNENVIGLLFVGIPTENLDNIINAHDVKMSKINILIIILRAISLGALIALVSASVSDKTTPIADKRGYIPIPFCYYKPLYLKLISASRNLFISRYLFIGSRVSINSRCMVSQAKTQPPINRLSWKTLETILSFPALLKAP